MNRDLIQGYGYTGYPNEYHVSLDPSLNVLIQILTILLLWNSAERDDSLAYRTEWMKDVEGGITQPSQYRGNLRPRCPPGTRHSICSEGLR